MIAVIPLTQGYQTIVDARDKEWVSSQCWRAKPSNRSALTIRYALGNRWSEGRSHAVYLHRAVFEHHCGPIPKGLQIDHINHNTLDNRLANLRVVTQAVNLSNRPPKPKKNGLPPGVYKQGRGFVGLVISLSLPGDKRGQYLGTFATPEEAGAAVQKKREELYGPPPTQPPDLYVRTTPVEAPL